ncbi:hypothetical protein LTR86_008787 [Recurvomyces mirabilis]|nr:hypothetical protein LTR86_008787 [Recurvomyces mirabilis]
MDLQSFTGLPTALDDTSSSLAPIAEDSQLNSQVWTVPAYFQPPAKRRRVESFPCHDCDTHFTTSRARARHNKTEQHLRNIGESPAAKYACSHPLCHKAFSRQHDRQRHEAEAHEGRRRPIVKPVVSGYGEYTQQRQAPSCGTSLWEYTFEEESVTVEHDVSPCNTWDRLGRHVEVMPGPANRTRTETATPRQITDDAQLSGYNDSAFDDSTPSSTQATTKETSTNADRQSQSWFDDDSESESAAMVPVSTRVGLSPYPSRRPSLPLKRSRTPDSVADEPEGTDHEPRRPSIMTFDYREDKISEDSEITEPDADDLAQEFAAKLDLANKPKMTVLQKDGIIKTIPVRPPLMCVFCNQPFPQDERALMPHLRQHLALFRGEQANQCTECQIWFVHKKDFELHKVNASTIGHCGYHFEHKTTCSGHHPPERNVSSDLSDRDKFMMREQLRHWEQSQLHLYMQEIARLTSKRSSTVGTCYSGDFLRRPRDSLSSFAISVNTYGSAPCDRPTGGSMDVGGLRSRLGLMSKGPRQVRRAAAKFLRTGGNANKALYNAATSGDCRQIEHLIEDGADPNAILGNQSILSAAARWADANTIKLLLELGASLSPSERKCISPLASAANSGKIGICQLLLAEGADVTESSSKYGCALGAAAASGNIPAAQLLLSHGAAVQQTGGDFYCPLSTACAQGSVSMVNFLLDECNADVNQMGGSEGSPLGFAAWQGPPKVVRVLLERGAKVDAPSPKHGSPLCAAIAKIARGLGSIDTVRLLLENGADVDQKNGPFNPLRVAASNADISAMTPVVKLLIEHGVDVHSLGSRGSALQLAKQRRQKWMEKKPLFSLDTTDEIDDIIGHCFEVTRLLTEATKIEEERRTSNLSWPSSESTAVSRLS